MQFKHPELLWALFLLIIPIIVHLFQLRRFEKVWFTNVAFLKEIQLQTRKSSTLKKWLTLITRLFIFATLIIAFAQPFLPSNSHIAKEKETVIYLDNSFSMQAKGSKGPLLQRAIQDIIANTESATEFTIFTNNNSFLATTLAPIQNKLLATGYSPQQLSYAEAYLKGSAYFSNKADTEKDFIFISDFQKLTDDFELKEVANINTHFVKVQPENLQNISIDSVYISKKETENIELSVLISAEKPVENVTVSLFNSEKIQAKTGTAIGENLKATVLFTIPANKAFEGYVSIKDNGLSYDNTLFFNLQKPEEINVLAISNAKDNFLKKLYTDEAFNYTSQNITALDYTQISQQHLVILNQLDNISSGLINALQTFVKNGGSIALIPSKDINTQSFNSLLNGSGISFTEALSASKNITNINFSHSLFANVFDKEVSNFQYPKVNSYYKINSDYSALTLEDGNPFLATSAHFYVFASALDLGNSNFQNSPLIVPTFYNIAQQSLQLPTLYYTIGKKNSVDIATQISGDAVLQIAQNDSKFIPMQESFANKVRIQTETLPTTAENYQIQYQDTNIQPISYNYGRQESNLKYFRITDYNLNVTNDLSALFDDLKSQGQDSGLWKWFVIFALLFLCVEMFILKFLK